MTDKFRILPMLAAAVFAASCIPGTVDEQFTETDSIRIEAGGQTVLEYNEDLCQLSFNRDRGEFGVYSDSMSDYFFVRLDNIPDDSGQIVTGDVRWTTEDDEKIRKNITLHTLKVQGDRIWLWNTSNRIGLEIAVLE